MIDYKPMVSFVLGGSIGSFITYFKIKNKCDKEKQDEINEIRKLYLIDKLERVPLVDEETTPGLKKSSVNEDMEDNQKNGDLKIEEINDSVFNEYIHKVSNYNPNDIRPTTEEIEQITEDEFGEEFDYDTITLYYYSDGILADSNDNIIDNANTILLPNFEKRFENDVLFIRNNRLQSDFEILKMSNKTYSEISE